MAVIARISTIQNDHVISHFSPSHSLVMPQTATSAVIR